MYSNWFFTVVFVLEMCLKVFALGMAGYLSDKWNQLDMIIVVLSVVGIILEILNEGTKLGVVEIPINISIIRVMRVLRIARVLKLLKTATRVSMQLWCRLRREWYQSCQILTRRHALGLKAWLQKYQL